MWYNVKFYCPIDSSFLSLEFISLKLVNVNAEIYFSSADFTGISLQTVETPIHGYKDNRPQYEALGITTEFVGLSQSLVLRSVMAMVG